MKRRSFSQMQLSIVMVIYFDILILRYIAAAMELSSHSNRFQYLLPYKTNWWKLIIITNMTIKNLRRQRKKFAGNISRLKYHTPNCVHSLLSSSFGGYSMYALQWILHISSEWNQWNWAQKISTSVLPRRDGKLFVDILQRRCTCIGSVSSYL